MLRIDWSIISNRVLDRHYLQLSQLIQQLQHPQRFGNARGSAHRHVDGNGLENLFLGRSRLQCPHGLADNAIHAPRPERDPQSYQTFDFGAKHPFLLHLVPPGRFVNH